MGLAAIRKLLQGDTTLAAAGIAASAVTGAKIAASAVSATKIAASAVMADALKYKLNTWSLAKDAVGALSAHSVTYSIVTTGKIIGTYLTKQTSYTNTPLYTQNASTILVSVSQALIGSDLVEGVIVTIEAQ